MSRFKDVFGDALPETEGLADIDRQERPLPGESGVDFLERTTPEPTTEEAPRSRFLEVFNLTPQFATEGGPVFPTEAYESGLESGGRALNNLMRLLGTEEAGSAQIARRILGVNAGEEAGVWSDQDDYIRLLRDAGIEDPIFNIPLGFIAGTLLSPSTYLSLGTSAAVKGGKRLMLNIPLYHSGKRIFLRRRLRQVFEDVAEGTITREEGRALAKEIADSAAGIELHIPQYVKEKLGTESGILKTGRGRNLPKIAKTRLENARRDFIRVVNDEGIDPGSVPPGLMGRYEALPTGIKRKVGEGRPLDEWITELGAGSQEEVFNRIEGNLRPIDTIETGVFRPGVSDVEQEVGGAVLEEALRLEARRPVSQGLRQRTPDELSEGVASALVNIEALPLSDKPGDIASGFGDWKQRGRALVRLKLGMGSWTRQPLTNAQRVTLEAFGWKPENIAELSRGQAAVNIEAEMLRSRVLRTQGKELNPRQRAGLSKVNELLREVGQPNLDVELPRVQPPRVEDTRARPADNQAELDRRFLEGLSEEARAKEIRTRKREQERKLKAGEIEETELENLDDLLKADEARKRQYTEARERITPTGEEIEQANIELQNIAAEAAEDEAMNVLPEPIREGVEDIKQSVTNSIQKPQAGAIPEFENAEVFRARVNEMRPEQLGYRNRAAEALAEIRRRPEVDAKDLALANALEVAADDTPMLRAIRPEVDEPPLLPVEKIPTSSDPGDLRTRERLSRAGESQGSALPVSGPEELGEAAQRSQGSRGVDITGGPGGGGLPPLPEALESPVARRAYQRVTELLTDPKQRRALFDYVHHANAIMKRWMILPFGSFHAHNIVGNAANMYLAGARDPRYFHEASLLQRGVLQGGTRWAKRDLWNEPWIAGYTGKKVRDLAVQHGVVDESMGTSRGFWKQGLEAIQGKRQIQGGKTLTHADLDYGKNIPSIDGEGNIVARGGKHVVRNLVELPFFSHVTQSIEENARLALFMDGLDRGLEPARAAARVDEFLFDYSDISKFEKDYMRLAVPFYTWMRKNIPLQMRELVKQPGTFTRANRIARTWDYALGDPPDPQYMADWMLDRSMIRVRKNRDGHWEFTPLENWIPGVDLQKIDPSKGLGVITDLAGEMLHPVFQLGATWGAGAMPWLDEAAQQRGYDLFRQKPLRERGLFFGRNVSGRVAKSLQQIRVLNEIDRLNPFDVFDYVKKHGKLEDGESVYRNGRKVTIKVPKRYDVGEKARWIRFLLGGTLYEYDVRRGAVYRRKEAVEEYRTSRFGAN